jgi:hypothetical protein
MTNPDPPFGNPSGEPYPWQDQPPAPVDPQVPLNYPDYPHAYPAPVPSVPPYGYPYQGRSAGYGGSPGYVGPQGYSSSYHPYHIALPETNGLAIGSLVTSIAGVVLGIPLTIFCYVGLLIPIVGTVLGVIALNQINQRHQQGRGLAITGIAVGAVTVVLMVGLAIAVVALALSPLPSR